jgi:hypothetical protein
MSSMRSLSRGHGAAVMTGDHQLGRAQRDILRSNPGDVLDRVCERTFVTGCDGPLKVLRLTLQLLEVRALRE